MEKKKGNAALIVVVIILIILLGTMCGTSGGSSSSSSRTCKSCGRSFTDSSNTMSIAKTGMCKNCYNNFKWGQDALGR